MKYYLKKTIKLQNQSSGGRTRWLQLPWCSGYHYYITQVLRRLKSVRKKNKINPILLVQTLLVGYQRFAMVRIFDSGCGCNQSLTPSVGLLLRKETITPAQMFFCEFCEIFYGSFLQNTRGCILMVASKLWQQNRT